MYCRTCGNKMNDNAEICVKCGVKRNVGTDFCQVCGYKTLASMANCKKCGAKLMRAMSSTQIKKKAVSKGKKAIGTVLFVIGLILLCVAVGSFAVGIMSERASVARDLFSAAGRCGVFGGFLFGMGKTLRKK